MKKLTLFLLASILAGCAGAQLKDDWTAKRGYSESDTNAAMEQMKEYRQSLIAAQTESNAFNSEPYNHERDRLRKIFCACVKKLGDKCRQKPDGLAGPEKVLWIKANAVDMAFAANETSLDAAPHYVIDPTECE